MLCNDSHDRFPSCIYTGLDRPSNESFLAALSWCALTGLPLSFPLGSVPLTSLQPHSLLFNTTVAGTLHTPPLDTTPVSTDEHRRKGDVQMKLAQVRNQSPNLNTDQNPPSPRTKASPPDVIQSRKRGLTRRVADCKASCCTPSP